MAKPPGQTIGDRVRVIRLARGLTQVQLAKLAEIGQSALSSIELGNTKYLRGGTLIRLARALSVSGGWLESGQGDPQRALPATTENAVAVTIFNTLTPANRDAWIAAGRALVASQGKHLPTPETPFTTAQPARHTAKKR